MATEPDTVPETSETKAPVEPIAEPETTPGGITPVENAPAEKAPPSAETEPTQPAKKEDPEITEEEAKEIVEEFEYLLEKSQQLFAGLRDLPEIGSKFWQPHFQRTFDVYTRLWKFQGQHRLLLEKPEHYGLKRWEVGEIASKIGQLYYRYYLRTSETNYLQEAFAFYDAIRERNYFKDERETKNSALMIKKLRYYARFIVVCLHMNYTSTMMQLLEEVRDLIDVYSMTFNPVDKLEWSLVVKEMALFMQAVCSPVPSDPSGVPLPVNYRLVARRRPRLDKDTPKFRLQQAIIVGNKPTQIKFSELTLDMHYMLQVLEREPTNNKDSSKETNAPPTTVASTAIPTAGTSVINTASLVSEGAQITEGDMGALADANRSSSSNVDPADDPVKTDVAPPAITAVPTQTEKHDDEKEVEREKTARRMNPHKYLLYLPNFSQIQVYLANAFREIGDQGCVLLYLSSDGSPAKAQQAESEACKYGFTGGIHTMQRQSPEGTKDRDIERLINTVHPVDLLPYTRKPFFLVVESECSQAYKGMPNLFSQSLLCLLSPTEYPTASSRGGLYTFFLHSPLLAFCGISQLSKIALPRWSELVELFSELEDLAFELLNTYVVDQGMRKFLSDDYLRQLMIRHVICCAMLQLHHDFTQPQHRPTSEPPFANEILEAPVLVRKVRDIVEFCSVEQFYRMEDRPASPVAEPAHAMDEVPVDPADTGEAVAAPEPPAPDQSPR